MESRVPKPPEYDGRLVFEVYPQGPEFRWRLWSASKRRQILADSGESYKTRNGASRAIDSIKANIVTGRVRVLHMTRDGYRRQSRSVA